MFWDTPYYLVPTGRPELTEPFAVIRDAMQGAGQVALGRVVMTGRERIVAIEVRGRGFLLSTLHAEDEVRSDAELFDAIPEVKPDPQMVDIARAIIGKQEGAFDPRQFKDRYAEALRKLVAEKSEGAIIDKQDDAPESNVIDLMEALRRSLGGAEPAPAAKKAASPSAAKGKPTAAKPEAAKSAAPRKRAASR